MTATSTKPRACSIVTAERQLTAVVKVRSPMSKLPETQRSSRAKLNAALPSLNVGPLGQTCTLWRPPSGGLLEMEAGVIVSRNFAPLGEVVPSALPGGRAAHFVLVGDYDGLPGAWNTLLGWCAAEKLPLAGVNWEIYGEWNEDSSKIETSLYALLA